MASFTVVYGANVLVPAVLRDLLLRLARDGFVRARFSTAILDEVVRALERIVPNADSARLERLHALIGRAVPDSLVDTYEPFSELVRLPDPKDAHVVAAALCCRAQAIVTMNGKDFPAEVLQLHSIEVLHPDDFVADLIDLAPVRVWQVIEAQAASLKNPPQTPHEVLDALRRHIPQSVGLLEEAMQG